MNWAILENNIVKNIIVANEGFITAHYPNAILVTGTCGIGWTYDDEKFVDTASIIKLSSTDEIIEQVN